MADTVFEYTHPSDDIAGSVTPTLTAGSQATGYEPAKLYNLDPSYPFKVSTTTFRLVWNWGAPVAPELIVLIHHNLSAGLSGVKFQMNSADSWGSPPFTQTLTVPDYHEDAFPANIHADLRAAAPLYQYGSLAVTSANAVACALGEIVIATSVRALDGTYMAGADGDEDHPLVEHRTDVGVSTIYSHGTRLRYVRGQMLLDGDDAASIRAWNRASRGRALPFVILPHHDPDDDEAWFVRFEKGSLPRRYFGAGGASEMALDFEEVSRGLKPTPSAV